MQNRDTRSGRIPHNAWLIICDGAKAIIACNAGTPDKPRLQVLETLHAQLNPASHEQGADRPGRMMQRGTLRRSSVAATDFHDLAEKKFLTAAAQRLVLVAGQHRTSGLVLIAPPRALALLREALGKSMRERVELEIDKDLTKHPIAEIEQLLTLERV
jgi:protein required for attachment to host cells